MHLAIYNWLGSNKPDELQTILKLMGIPREDIETALAALKKRRMVVIRDAVKDDDLRLTLPDVDVMTVSETASELATKVTRETLKFLKTQRAASKTQVTEAAMDALNEIRFYLAPRLFAAQALEDNPTDRLLVVDAGDML